MGKKRTKSKGSKGRKRPSKRKSAGANSRYARVGKDYQHPATHPATLSAQVAPGTTTPHATVMIADQPEWTPFVQFRLRENDGAAMYENSRYLCAVYPPNRNAVPDGFPPVVHISFKHILNVAITDFRDMQTIKNALVGEEAMAVQIFPPENCLVDGANQYHLWCFVPNEWPNVTEESEWPVLPIGFGTRLVTDKPTGKCRQRTFEAHHGHTEQDNLDTEAALEAALKAARESEAGKEARKMLVPK